MIKAGDYVLENSFHPQQDEFPYKSRQYFYINDQQAGVYTSPQISIEATQLTNSGKYFSASESFLAIPLVTTLVATTGNLTSDVANAFAVSLKNGTHHLIHSMQVQISNIDVVNLTQFSNLKINYKILSQWGSDDVNTRGGILNMPGGCDSYLSEQYQASASKYGVGSCNNSIVPITTSGFTAFNGYGYFNDGNVSRRARMMQTSFDPNNSQFQSNFITSANCNTVNKSYCATSSSTSAITYYIMATIPLSILHDLFKKWALVKNVYLRMVLNLNANFTSNITVGSSGTTFTTFTTTSNGGTCPHMVSPLSGAGVSSATTSIGIDASSNLTALTVNTSISSYTLNGTTYKTGHYSGCRMFACMYELSPEQEENYLRTVPQKTILYNDFYFFNQNLTGIIPGGNVNALLTTGISRLRGLLVVPQIAASVHGSTIAGLQSGTYAAGVGQLGSPLLSPFSSAPATCCPYFKANNVNVLIAGTPYFQQPLNYSWELFSEIRKQGIYGNEFWGLSSGLITQDQWETNMGFLWFDLSRWQNEAEDNALKMVQLQLTNGCNTTVDLYAFLVYEREISISISTGQLITG
jgi:hypothetical protein